MSNIYDSLSTSRRIINEFILSGYIVGREFRTLDDGGVIFTVAHRCEANDRILYTPCVMFPEIRGHKIAIPRELLRKSSDVIVRGFMKPRDYISPDGRLRRSTAFFVLEAIPNDGKTWFRNG